MTPPLQQDLAQLTTLLERAKTESLAYLSSLDSLPTNAVYVPEPTGNQLPQQGMGTLAALDEFKTTAVFTSLV